MFTNKFDKWVFEKLRHLDHDRNCYTKIDLQHNTLYMYIKNTMYNIRELQHISNILREPKCVLDSLSAQDYIETASSSSESAQTYVNFRLTFNSLFKSLEIQNFIEKFLPMPIYAKLTAMHTSFGASTVLPSPRDYEYTHASMNYAPSITVPTRVNYSSYFSTPIRVDE